MIWHLIFQLRSLSIGAPQGCVLSPLLFFPYTTDCKSKNSAVKLMLNLKIADNTTITRLIQDGIETGYRQEVEQLIFWCRHQNLELNTIEMTLDFRRHPSTLLPLTTVFTVEIFKFLGTTICKDL